MGMNGPTPAAKRNDLELAPNQCVCGLKNAYKTDAMTSTAISKEKQPHLNKPQPRDNTKKQNGTNVDDALLDDVVDDSVFSEDQKESEITDENQRSESRVEPRRKI